MPKGAGITPLYLICYSTLYAIAKQSVCHICGSVKNG